MDAPSGDPRMSAAPIRAMVKAMQSAGCDAEQIVAAVLAFEADDAQAAVRREKDRDRKRAERAKEKAPTSTPVQRTHADSADSADTSDSTPLARVLYGEDNLYITPVKPSVLLPQTENRTEPPIAKPQAPHVLQDASAAPHGAANLKTRQARRADGRGERIPPDWTPDPAGRQFAAETLGNPAAVDGEADKFRDYWTAKPGADGRKADWQAAWRIWIRRAAERLQPAAGPANIIPWTQRSANHEPDRSAASAAWRLVERLRSEEACRETDPWPLLGAPGG